MNYNHMNKGKFLIAVCIVIVIAAVALRIFYKEDTSTPNPESTASTTGTISPENTASSTETPLLGSDRDEHGCIGTAGYAWCGVKEKCIRFFEEPCEILAASTSEIAIFSPLPGTVLASPFSVSGQAKGTWFFEANLPVKLLDENDNIILAHFATATSDWMTEALVPFAGELAFTTAATSGYLLISKDNPSDLPQNDAAIRIPVKFK